MHAKATVQALCVDGWTECWHVYKNVAKIVKAAPAFKAIRTSYGKFVEGWLRPNHLKLGCELSKKIRSAAAELT